MEYFSMKVYQTQVYQDDYRKIARFFRMVKRAQKGKHDGKVLEMAFKLVFYCGLKKNELIRIKLSKTIVNFYKIDKTADHRLNIKHRFKKDRDNSVFSRDIEIPEKARKLLKDYILHLSKRSKTGPCSYHFDYASPLFPQSDGEENTIDLLDYYMKRYTGKLNKSIGSTFKDFSFEYLRQAGIRYYYLRLLKKGYSPEDALEQTIDFSSNTKYHVRDILLNQIKK